MKPWRGAVKKEIRISYTCISSWRTGSHRSLFICVNAKKACAHAVSPSSSQMQSSSTHSSAPSSRPPECKLLGSAGEPTRYCDRAMQLDSRSVALAHLPDFGGDKNFSKAPQIGHSWDKIPASPGRGSKVRTNRIPLRIFLYKLGMLSLLHRQCRRVSQHEYYSYLRCFSL